MSRVLPGSSGDTYLAQLDVFRRVVFLDMNGDVRALGDELGVDGEHGGCAEGLWKGTGVRVDIGRPGL